MATRSLTSLAVRIPIWVRVSGIVALVLVGVVVGSLLVGRVSAGGHARGSHGQMGQMGTTDQRAGPQPTGGAGTTQHSGTPGPAGQHTPSDGARGH